MEQKPEGRFFPNNFNASISLPVTLRDYFAAKALAYICHFNILEAAMTERDAELQTLNAAAFAYRMADAMLAERAK